MKKITLLFSLLAVLFAHAQYTGPGFYRVQNANTKSYICIKGTHFNKLKTPEAFWPCILMQNDPDQMSDPGSIIFIPDTAERNLYGQGVSTYSLTGLPLEISLAKQNEGGKETYLAKTFYDGFPCFFRDYGNGMTAGYGDKTETRWWIEPVNKESMDYSYFGIKPVNNADQDSEIQYWSTLCCDFPCMIPEEGGVEGAYTVKDVKVGEDMIARVIPEKLYGQGDIIPAATPVLIKCTSPDVEGNKLIPVGEIANRTAMPITADLLMGNYFSIFSNHSDLFEYDVMTNYLPAQATAAAATYLALGVDEDGTVGFFPKEEGTYMDANTAWLDITSLELEDVTAVYLTEEEEEEPNENVTKGDFNGDGVVTIDDVALLINYLLTCDDETPAKDVNMESADMNNDGLITIDDVTLLINYLLTCE